MTSIALFLHSRSRFQSEQIAFLCQGFVIFQTAFLQVQLFKGILHPKMKILEAASYGFVELVDETSVERCLRKVNGKPLPGATPVIIYHTLHAPHSYSTFCLFVSDLTPDVDDGMLYEFFHYRFSSCCSGKIVLYNNGYSKCCGFVSFESERDQRRALAELQGAIGLGKKTLRLSLATNKLKKKESTESQNWKYHAGSYISHNLYLNQCCYDYGEMEDDDLEYPDSELNVTEVNQRFMEQSEEFYSALIGCFFQPPESWDGVPCSVMCYLPEPIYHYEEIN
ncbi:tRNA selenocysteine 1-associated protein 1 [Triplophysa rosa]|uniref:tRNA selenocysteine 1-associated protein 1 n=1 Tax=Triplophysa rosa TaxID=992332 RepID=A0A9W7TN64_TRIRA|nr:tRNA selenocysteine 1-associated protein 1 [Triplophysa rosa]